ncbi:uncharacterized protein LOC100208656 isoform X1 [Hydra vulgaris]|uniref:uncharacterized protein LOC100208656 isoform X1 n=1 Tax=Hydra vulgaris TaxID=6087 RepID=UPI001F5EDF65|nr:uncharacterized protein LOC100208656 isoform X1 [Hydra vulgaris]
MTLPKVNILDIGANIIQSQLLKSPPGPKLYQENSWHIRYFSLLKIKDDYAYSCCRVRVSKGFTKLDTSQKIFLAYWDSALSFFSKKNPIRVLPLYKEALPCQRQHPINPVKYPFVFAMDIAHRRLFLCADNSVMYEEWVSKVSEQLLNNEKQKIISQSNFKQSELQNQSPSIWSCASESSTDSDNSFSKLSLSEMVFEALSSSISSFPTTTNKVNIRRYTTSNSKELNEKITPLASSTSLPLPSTFYNSHGGNSQVETKEIMHENNQKIKLSSNDTMETTEPTKHTEMKDQLIKSHKSLSRQRSASVGHIDIKFNQSPKPVNINDGIHSKNIASELFAIENKTIEISSSLLSSNKVFKTPQIISEDIILQQPGHLTEKYQSKIYESEYAASKDCKNDKSLLSSLNNSDKGSGVNIEDVNGEVRDKNSHYEKQQSFELTSNITIENNEIFKKEEKIDQVLRPNHHKPLTFKRSVSTGDIHAAEWNSEYQNKTEKFNSLLKFFKTHKKTTDEPRLNNLVHSFQDNYDETCENEKTSTYKKISNFFTLRRNKNLFNENSTHKTILKIGNECNTQLATNTQLINHSMTAGKKKSFDKSTSNIMDSLTCKKEDTEISSKQIQTDLNDNISYTSTSPRIISDKIYHNTSHQDANCVVYDKTCEHILHFKDMKVIFPQNSKIILAKENLEVISEKTRCTFQINSSDQPFNNIFIS